MVLGTGSTLKQPFTSTVEDYNFTRLPIKDPDEPKKRPFPIFGYAQGSKSEDC
jgi:hypothetical protein